MQIASKVVEVVGTVSELAAPWFVGVTTGAWVVTATWQLFFCGQSFSMRKKPFLQTLVSTE